MCRPLSFVVLKSGRILPFTCISDHSHTTILKNNKIADTTGGSFDQRPFTRVEIYPVTGVVGAEYSPSGSNAAWISNPDTWKLCHDDGSSNGRVKNDAPAWWTNLHDKALRNAVRTWQTTGRKNLNAAQANKAFTSITPAKAAAAARAAARRAAREKALLTKYTKAANIVGIALEQHSSYNSGYMSLSSQDLKSLDAVKTALRNDLADLRHDLKGLQKALTKAIAVR